MSWLLATFNVQESRTAEFEGIMRDLITQVRANEPGTLTYTLVKSKKEPNTYIMIENYASREARDLHGNTDYFKAAV
ncbi:MAG: putative quinol monooxygenase, partial [Caulobacterales bacterium]